MRRGCGIILDALTGLALSKQNKSNGLVHSLTDFFAPNANACAERFVRTVRQEISDKVLILNEAHLRRVLTEFPDYYNTRRPHQGHDQQSPIERPEPLTQGLVRKRLVLGGILNDCFRVPPLNVPAQPA